MTTSIRPGMATLLTLTGHDVATAHSGPEAIAAAQLTGPRSSCSIIGLPGMDGYEVVKRLRQDPCCEHSVIIAASGYGQEADRPPHQRGRIRLLSGQAHRLRRPLIAPRQRHDNLTDV